MCAISSGASRLGFEQASRKGALVRLQTLLEQSESKSGNGFRSEFTRGLSLPAAENVLDPLEDGMLFLHLPSLQDFFPPPVVDMGRRHVADAFVVAAVIVELE